MEAIQQEDSLGTPLIQWDRIWASTNLKEETDLESD
jgi:hypothetical protein